MARVVSINSSKNKDEIKLPVEKGLLLRDGGLAGDAHAGDGHRQLSLLAKESIDEMRAVGIENLNYGIFAENITTQGIILHTLPVGTRLRIGRCIVEITQIGKQCHSGCEIFKKVGKCVMPTQGVFARVIEGGEFLLNDEIEVMGDEGKALLDFRK
ncbi:MAG: MOSC domain-containing protein [Clostridiales bacterium]|nr:MOSC domain-containing protein [Clostridiales bacterium]